MSTESKADARGRGRHLLVVDGANALFRAFFAIPHLRAPDGTPTNAVYGFVSMLGKLLREEQPDMVAVAMDPRGGSFRKRVFSEYKSHRDAMPEDLASQLDTFREAIEAFNIPLIEVKDFEADDVIATLVAHAPEDVRISIVSTDKDLMQLVCDRVTLIDSVKDKRIGPSEVEARFGVPPEQILDLRALVGDPSDNIPGVKGIGEKGAAKLIREWGSLQSLLDNADAITAKRAREGLQGQRREAELSRQLATLRTDVPLELGDDWRAALARRDLDVERLRALYRRLGFTRLIAALDEAAPGSAVSAGASSSDTDEIEVEILTDAAAVRSRLKQAAKPLLTLHWIYGEGSAVASMPVGLAVALAPDRAAFVPIVGDDRVAEAGLDAEELVEALSRLLAGRDDPTSGVGWCGVSTKHSASLMAEAGFAPGDPSDDLEIASFMLDPAGAHGVSPMAAGMLGRAVESWEDLAGRGAKAVAAESIPTERLARWAAAQVCAIAALRPLVRERLEKDGLVELYEEVELPLTRVLSDMERAGVRIDEKKLAELAREYTRTLARLEEEIYELAGERFLIASPKQLQVILFDKLGLSPLKKTKTGYSTAEAVLEQLRSDHPLPGKILDHRKLAKLMSTYIESLPRLVDERTGRIHPQFNQLGAATGRLSAQNPNVQNIPIRGDEGARIREAFVPADGRLLLSADYSQVELRILAHYSGDESLIDAFTRGEDIHRRTAAEVRGIAVDEVDDEARARAKAVNFGIIYGSSSFGLANQLGIAAGEAQEIIDAYFERYQGVRRFLDDTIAEAKERGFVATLLGRRRYLPDLASRNRVQRQAAERMAVNTVIQGTAADLIKRAMVRISDALRGTDLVATAILQVHDELVFEVAPRDVEALASLLREQMEGALDLRVPLRTEIGVGKNWREAH